MAPEVLSPRKIRREICSAMSGTSIRFALTVKLFRPILQGQTRNLLKVADVASHEHRIVFQNHCGDAQVHFSDLEFEFLQFFAAFYGRRIKIKDLKFSEGPSSYCQSAVGIRQLIRRFGL